MPYLDELRNRLQLRSGDLITEEWYTDLVTYLRTIEKEGAVDYSGIVHRDLIPDKDAVHNLGSSSLRFNNIHAVRGAFSEELTVNNIYAAKGEFAEELKVNFINAVEGNFSENIETTNIYAVKGEFSEDLRVQGKKVIKDEDPIHIATFFDYAKRQITESVIDALLNLGIPPKPVLIAYKVDYYAPAMVDVFDPDILVKFDGKVRIKATTTSDVYLYLKHIANMVGVEITSLLTTIKKNTWIEKDFTVNKDDKVNVKVLPSCKITIYIYNIPEA